MARSKRSPVERATFLALSAALIVGAWICIHRAAYPVTEPYQFPVTTDSPEWAELAEAGLARNACRLPAGLAEQMTSEALLETALDYPYVSSILAFSDPVQGFWSNAKYNDALAELVTRPNAAAVVERAFSSLLIAGEYHTDYPEENDIISGYQYVGWIEIIKLLGILRPA